MNNSRARVVIVGGGFGGLEAARALARAPVDIVLLDRRNHHCFQPLLYQVATAALSPADVAWPIRGILRGQANARVLLAEVTGIDAEARTVHAGDLAIPFDFLVLATGATHSYFGQDAWAAVAPGLKTIDDATAIRRSLLLAFERAEASTDAAAREVLLTAVIVGGGPTGVEMAGAMVELAHFTLARDFRNIDPRKARVILLEAGPRILASFPASLCDYATRSLRRMGVEVWTDSRVTGCDAEGVDTSAGRIACRTIVWAAGVVASPAAAWLGAAHDKAGRVLVGPDFEVPSRPGIFVVGDTAAVISEGKPVPGLAPAAKQMGRHVGAVVAARVAGSPPPRPFRYRHEGDLATIGRRSAIVSLGRLRLTGFVGWLFWCVIHIYFLISMRNRIGVAFKWLWDYVTFQRGVRLITGDDDGQRI